MKKLIVLSILVMSSFANAAIYQFGDFTTGSVSAPAAGAVIADTGAMTFTGPNYDTYNLSFSASCTLTCNLTVGIYSSTGSPLKTYVINVPGGGTVAIPVNHMALTGSNRLEVINNTSNLGTVSGSIASSILQSY